MNERLGATRVNVDGC